VVEKESPFLKRCGIFRLPESALTSKVTSPAKRKTNRQKQKEMVSTLPSDPKGKHYRSAMNFCFKAKTKNKDAQAGL